jgi:hypothetical protein
MNGDESLPNLSGIIHNPATVAVIGLDFVKALEATRDRLVPMGLPGMGGYFGPLLPGDLVSVIAKSHNGKSLFLRDWAHRLGNYLEARGRDELIVWVDTETPVDHLALGQLATAANTGVPQIVYEGAYDLGALLTAAKSVGRGRIVYIATKLGEDDQEVTLTNIMNALRLMTTGAWDGKKHKLAAIFVDYLQALPFDPAVKRQRDMDSQRRIQVSNDVNTCRRMGATFNCPVILAVQAKQDDEWALKTRTSKEEYAKGIQGNISVAGFWAGQETGNIGQRSDRIIGLGMPKTEHPIGTRLLYKDQYIDVTDGLMVVQVHKQRMEGLASGSAFFYEIDHAAPAGEKFALVYGE